MTDTIIKGSGNSRTLKTVPNAITLYPDWSSAVQAMINGTFPIDLGPLNSAGIDVRGTDLSKANLLSDATATGMGLTSSATPNEALAKLRSLITTAQSTVDTKANITSGTYAGTSNAAGLDGNITNDIICGFVPKLLIISSQANSNATVYSVGSTCIYTGQNGDRWASTSQAYRNYSVLSNGIRITSQYANAAMTSNGSNYYWIAVK